MPNAILLTSQVLALMTMFGMSTCAAERRIEIPLEQSGGLPVAEVVSALAQASGVTIERPAVKLTLPTRGLAGSLTKTLLGECLGPEVRLAFRPGVVVIAVDEDELAADRCAEWKRRLDELSARSVQAASRQQYYGMRALASFRANDPRRPTVCLVHGINSSSGGFVHVIPLLEQAGYGIVVFDYPFNQRLDDSSRSSGATGSPSARRPARTSPGQSSPTRWGRSWPDHTWRGRIGPIVMWHR